MKKTSKKTSNDITLKFDCGCELFFHTFEAGYGVAHNCWEVEKLCPDHELALWNQSDIGVKRL